MRINNLKIIFVCFFLVLIASFLQKQIFYFETYRLLSEKNRIRIRSIAAPRGLITDRKGVVLAGNRISFEVVVVPQEIKDSQLIFNLLSEVLNRPAEVLIENYKRNYVAPFAPVTIAEDITKEEAIHLEERSLFLPGVMVVTKPVRYYPLREASSHIIGYLGEINWQELHKLKPYGYRIRELIGKEGVEKTYNIYLKGENGGMQVEVDSQGRQVDILGYKPPKKGNDLQLTIDAKLQEKVYQLIKERKAAVTVIEPNTGEILAMSSSPSFNPNIFVNHGHQKEILSLLNNPQHPFLNRNIQATYPPGSLFKILIASAALQEKKIDRYTSFVCPGFFKLGNRTFACWDEEGHGRQTVIEAIKHSCNVFFYNTGLRLGVDLIYKYAQEFGFSQLTGIDLPFEAKGVVPSRQWKRQQLGQMWYKGETVIYSIGQGYLSVTPLQILRMVSAVANGGRIIKPYLVKKIGEVHAAEPSFRELRVNRENLDLVKKGMEEVTKSGGTGYRVAVEGLNIAGKTATAQTPQGEPHAWFSGFAPVQNPKVAVVVVLEHGGKGGLGAVDVAREIFSFIKENYNLNEANPFGKG
jgi:penicillin-binding protein 2